MITFTNNSYPNISLNEKMNIENAIKTALYDLNDLTKNIIPIHINIYDKFSTKKKEINESALAFTDLTYTEYPIEYIIQNVKNPMVCTYLSNIKITKFTQNKTFFPKYIGLSHIQSYLLGLSVDKIEINFYFCQDYSYWFFEHIAEPDKFDIITVMIHELLHNYGFISVLDENIKVVSLWDYLTVTGKYIDPFIKLTFPTDSSHFNTKKIKRPMMQLDLISGTVQQIQNIDRYALRALGYWIFDDLVQIDLIGSHSLNINKYDTFIDPGAIIIGNGNLKMVIKSVNMIDTHKSGTRYLIYSPEYVDKKIIKNSPIRIIKVV
jgi:hypothetical protein